MMQHAISILYKLLFLTVSSDKTKLQWMALGPSFMQYSFLLLGACKNNCDHLWENRPSPRIN